MNKIQIKKLIEVAIKSGEIALEYFYDKDLAIDKKIDNSPVTKADKEISNLISVFLEENFKDISIICEEGRNRNIKGNKFWLIDPIDGTRGFIAKKDEFTINIALIENNTPIFGLIYAPRMPGSPLYYIDENKDLICLSVKGGTQKIINKENRTDRKITRVVSSKRSSNEDVVEYIRSNFQEVDTANLLISRMSSSFKFCEILDDKADLFLNINPTMEWDSAAGHALILAKGGKVLGLNKSDLLYNKKSFINSGFVVIF
jgi:3'(2'), 5'-bisphosphate nucleotidase